MDQNDWKLETLNIILLTLGTLFDEIKSSNYLLIAIVFGTIIYTYLVLWGSEYV